jgi:hypothetical protein
VAGKFARGNALKIPVDENEFLYRYRVERSNRKIFLPILESPVEQVPTDSSSAGVFLLAADDHGLARLAPGPDWE